MLDSDNERSVEYDIGIQVLHALLKSCLAQVETRMIDADLLEDAADVTKRISGQEQVLIPSIDYVDYVDYFRTPDHVRALAATVSFELMKLVALACS